MFVAIVMSRSRPEAKKIHPRHDVSVTARTQPPVENGMHFFREKIARDCCPDLVPGAVAQSYGGIALTTYSCGIVRLS